MVPIEQRKGLRTWVEVDKSAIAHNYRVFRSSLSPGAKLMAVVKSNAYGHGLTDFTKEILALGADWIAVDSVVEALTLRKEGISAPILVLGFTLPEMLAEAAAQDISITVSSSDSLVWISSGIFSKKVRIHLKVDTGMHRQGFLLSDSALVTEQLKEISAKVSVEGLYTHFASAKSPAYPHFTKEQVKVFELWRQEFKQAGFSPLCHAGATAGALLFPEAQFDIARVGIGLYGLWPANDVRAAFQNKLSLMPALSWKTLISEKKMVPKGETVGYDRTEQLKRDSIVAVCPVGYWHGYSRNLSNIGKVLVRGKKARVLGRVCMDMIMIDVTDIPDVKILDEVILIGADGKEEVSANDMANLSTTSHYEIVTRINPLIKRIYI